MRCVPKASVDSTVLECEAGCIDVGARGKGAARRGCLRTAFSMSFL